MYEWVKGNAYNLNVTIYKTNITLNSACAAYFSDVRWVRIGLDTANQKIAIKPIPKQWIELKLIPLEELHKISIGNGYGRISNKALIKSIETMTHTTMDGCKFSAIFNDKEELLEIDCRNPW